MNGCEYFEQLCAVSIDGTLTDEERKSLDAHLAECPSCAALYEELHQMDELLHTPVTIPPSLHRDIMARVREEAKPRIVQLEKPMRHSPVIAFVAAAAVVALVAMGGGIGQFFNLWEQLGMGSDSAGNGAPDWNMSGSIEDGAAARSAESPSAFSSREAVPRDPVDIPESAADPGDGWATDSASDSFDGSDSGWTTGSAGDSNGSNGDWTTDSAGDSSGSNGGWATGSASDSSGGSSGSNGGWATGSSGDSNNGYASGSGGSSGAGGANGGSDSSGSAGSSGGLGRADSSGNSPTSGGGGSAAQQSDSSYMGDSSGDDSEETETNSAAPAPVPAPTPVPILPPLGASSKSGDLPESEPFDYSDNAGRSDKSSRTIEEAAPAPAAYDNTAIALPDSIQGSVVAHCYLAIGDGELPAIDGDLLVTDGDISYFSVANNMSLLEKTLSDIEEAGYSVTPYEGVGLVTDAKAASWLLIVQNQ